MSSVIIRLMLGARDEGDDQRRDIGIGRDEVVPEFRISGKVGRRSLRLLNGTNADEEDETKDRRDDEGEKSRLRRCGNWQRWRISPSVMRFTQTRFPPGRSNFRRMPPAFDAGIGGIKLFAEGLIRGGQFSA